jgi:putative membrane protein
MTCSTRLISTALAILMLGGCAYVQQTLPSLMLTDAEMVGVLNSISAGEVEAAELARQMSSTSEIQSFAGRVLNEHHQLVEIHGRLAQQLDLTPQLPALASLLKSTHETAMHDLEGKSGSAFDRAYIHYEIARHVRAFTLLEAAAETEGTLLLRQELVRTGPDLLSHLSAARALERRLVAQEVETNGAP